MKRWICWRIFFVSDHTFRQIWPPFNLPTILSPRGAQTGARISPLPARLGENWVSGVPVVRQFSPCYLIAKLINLTLLPTPQELEGLCKQEDSYEVGCLFIQEIIIMMYSVSCSASIFVVIGAGRDHRNPPRVPKQSPSFDMPSGTGVKP